MLTQETLASWATSVLKSHTIELCDSMGQPIAMHTDGNELATAILALNTDSYLSFKRINSDCFMGGVGVNKHRDGTASFRCFNRAIEHLDPKNLKYAPSFT